MAFKPVDLRNPQVRAEALEHEKEVLRIRREAQRVVDAEERPAPREVEIATLRERLAQPRDPVVWRVSQLQAVGHRVQIAAQFKVGKTTLVGNLARALLDDMPFLDTYDVSPLDGSFAVLDFEMSGEQLTRWYGDMGICNDDRLVLISMRGAAASFDLLNPRIFESWVERLRQCGVQYLSIDCLRPVLDALGLDERTEAGVFLTVLDRLLLEASISESLLVTHMGHQHERARGDSRLLDWPDALWTLVREREDDLSSSRFLRAFGRDVDVPETKLSYSAQTRRLAVEGGSRANTKVEAAFADICRRLRECPDGLSGRAITNVLSDFGHTQKAVRSALKAGVERKALTSERGKGSRHVFTLTHQAASKGADAFDLAPTAAEVPELWNVSTKENADK